MVEKYLSVDNVKELGASGDLCWAGIVEKDISKLGEGMKRTLLAWRNMLPHAVTDWVLQEMNTKWFHHYPVAITSGSGGGYVIVASESDVPGAMKVRVKY